MPRNVAKPLSVTDHMRQRVNATSLLNAGKEGVVTIDYVKRNGETSSSKGTVTHFSGRPGYDTGSVTIDDPIKGARTVNLHRIIDIRPEI